MCSTWKSSCGTRFVYLHSQINHRYRSTYSERSDFIPIAGQLARVGLYSPGRLAHSGLPLLKRRHLSDIKLSEGGCLIRKAAYLGVIFIWTDWPLSALTVRYGKPSTSPGGWLTYLKTAMLLTC